VHCLYAAIVGLIVILGLAAQNDPKREPESPPAEQADQYFSGVIVGLSPEKLTVSRTVLGATSSRTFLIGAETQVEGKLAVKARVTVKYVTREEEDRAVHILVRDPPKK
jgi:hypothetical protein